MKVWHINRFINACHTQLCTILNKQFALNKLIFPCATMNLCTLSPVYWIRMKKKITICVSPLFLAAFFTYTTSFLPFFVLPILFSMIKFSDSQRNFHAQFCFWECRTYSIPTQLYWPKNFLYSVDKLDVPIFMKLPNVFGVLGYVKWTD